MFLATFPPDAAAGEHERLVRGARACGSMCCACVGTAVARAGGSWPHRPRGCCAVPRGVLGGLVRRASRVYRRGGAHSGRARTAGAGGGRWRRRRQRPGRGGDGGTWRRSERERATTVLRGPQEHERQAAQGPDARQGCAQMSGGALLCSTCRRAHAVCVLSREACLADRHRVLT